MLKAKFTFTGRTLANKEDFFLLYFSLIDKLNFIVYYSSDNEEFMMKNKVCYTIKLKNKNRV